MTPEENQRLAMYAREFLDNPACQHLFGHIKAEQIALLKRAPIKADNLRLRCTFLLNVLDRFESGLQQMVNAGKFEMAESEEEKVKRFPLF